MIGFGWVRTYLGDVFLIIYEFSFLLFFGWIFGKMDQKRKIRAIAGVLRSDEETPHSGEGSPHHSEAEREGWPDLEFAATKPLFTAWKCCVFVSFCFSVVPKTCLLD